MKSNSEFLTSKGKQVTAFKKKNLKPTVKHGGGGIMIWGWLIASGDGWLTFIDSALDHMGYLNVLKENWRQSTQNLNLGDDFWF